jgi:hypothetical protein
VAASEDVAAALGTLRQSAGSAAVVPVEGAGEPVFWEGAAMHFQWTIGQRVTRSEGLRPWYEAIYSTLHTLGLVREWDWERWRPYVTVLRGGEGRPVPDEVARAKALRVLRARRRAVDFMTEQLWVSCLEDGQFRRVASVQLAGDGEKVV